MNRALDPLAAQLLLRAYARATNMLIAGRSFATDDPTLAALLRAFGAHVGPLSGAEATPASSPVVFALEEDAAPRPGAITVLAPGGSFHAVIAPDAPWLPWWRADAWGSPSSLNPRLRPSPSCSPRPGRA